MKWRKIKRVFSPDNDFEWMASHAANPFAVPLEKSIYRVFFTSRNKINQSHVSSLVFDLSNLSVIDIENKPVVSPGKPGLFDDSGCAMGFYLNTVEKEMIYYLGWNLKVTVPWLNAIGLAIFDDKTDAFEKFSDAPLMDRSHEDPYSISYPSIIKIGDQYKMWYGSNLGWGKDQEDMKHVFKTAFSDNGINWTRSGKIELDLTHPNEYALSKPFVLRNENDSYEMWYSCRGRGAIKTYRIGYAISEDGSCWTRRDDAAGIDVSKSGWDSEMICYPFVFDYEGKRLMLYNGNGYGKTGFGIAILEK